MRKLLSNIILLAVLAVSMQGCASLLVQGSTHPVKRSYQGLENSWEKILPGIKPWIDSMQTCGALRDTFAIVNGCRLHSFYAEAPVPSGKTAIVIHGYMVNEISVMAISRMYRDSLGYNIWLPCLRYFGKSGGEAVQFGWNDRIDALEWSRIAHERFGDTLQVMHGTSMGAATTMMASGEDTPEYLRGFVEDCGYTSVYDQFKYVSAEKLHVGEKTFRKAAEINERRFGWSYDEASSVKQVAKCTKPMLFIHGEKDKFVPTWMAEACYNAKTQGYRELWITQESGHTQSFPEHMDEYVTKVRTFLKEHVE